MNKNNKKHVYVFYGAPKTGKTDITECMPADILHGKPDALNLSVVPMSNKYLIIDDIDGKKLVEGLSDLVGPITTADLRNNDYIWAILHAPHKNIILIVNDAVSDYYEELVNRSISCAEEFCERALSLFGDEMVVSLVNFKSIEMESGNNGGTR